MLLNRSCQFYAYQRALNSSSLSLQTDVPFEPKYSVQNLMLYTFHEIIG